MISRSSYILIILLLMELTAFGQSKTIEGIVFDSSKQKPLAFATIGVSGTMVGTASNADGRFTLAISENLMDSTFVVSYMGFKNFNIKAREIHGPLEIKMEQDAISFRK